MTRFSRRWASSRNRVPQWSGLAAVLCADWGKAVAKRAVYVAAGEVEARQRRFGAGKMLVFDKGEDTTLAAVQHSTLMALGGEPVGERFIDWNFVSSKRERIEQAKADWRAGRMKLPDFDNREFIPLA